MDASLPIPGPRLAEPGALDSRALQSAGVRPPVDVLVAGLGDLGIAVARTLARNDGVRVHLFDPDPVTPLDVGPLFALDEVGMTRGDIVARRLTAPGRSAPCVVPMAATSAAQREAALGAWLARVDAVIACGDRSGHLASMVTSLCRSSGVPLVTAEIDEARGVIDPLCVGLHSDVSLGCPACAALHRADRDASLGPAANDPSDRVRQSAIGGNVRSEADVAVLADLVLLALSQAVEIGRGQRAIEAKSVTVDFRQRAATVESVAKHHACKSCFPESAGGLHAVLATAGTWLESLDRQPDSTLVDLATLHHKLRPLIGEHYGLFPKPIRSSDSLRHAVWRFFRSRGVNPKESNLATAHSALTLRSSIYAGRNASAVSEGFDFSDPLAAETLSLVEGLERLFAMSYCEPDRIVRARYSDIAADAFDPRSFLLYADWQYAQPGFSLQRFDSDQAIRWVSAVDLAAGRPVLVPFDLVYDDGAPAAIYRTNSNGAACHTNLRQAIVNAICEVVERDALLVAWLHRLSLPRVALGREAADPWGFRATLDRLDLELEHVDISTDLDIPVLLGVLRDRRNPDLFLVDMVASLDPQRRLHKLYRELAQFLQPYLIKQTHFASERTHDPDADKVVSFPDHAAFYQSAARQRLASFLTASPTVKAFADGESPTESDAPGELDAMMQRLSAAGLQVLVVNCTVPLLQRLGLHAVKVLIPGLQQLNAQHRLRMLGGDRLFSAPQRMQLAQSKRDAADLNPWPHPFW